MEIEWKQALISKAEEVMSRGGELRLIVIKRGRERIPEIYTYFDNKIRCKTETLLD